MFMNYLLILTGVLFLAVSGESGTDIAEEMTFHRSRRQLLFPNSTMLQFNFGIGTPTPAALVNLNYAFQANFQLPWNRSQIPFDVLEAYDGYTGTSRKKRDVDNALDAEEKSGYESDGRLYHFYKYVEDFLSGVGLNGTACVLRTLCDLGAEPLHSEDEEDLLHELATFVLNPKNDINHPGYHNEILPYIEAYEHGEHERNCAEIYRSCPTQLIDLFSKPYGVS